MAGFRKATPEKFPLKLGIYGPLGAGKTATALLEGEGLKDHTGKRIAFVDTEEGTKWYDRDVPERRFHPKAWDFDRMVSRSVTEIHDAVKNLDPEYGVIIVDSITHVWEACQAAYAGYLTKAGTLPLNAWNTIKKPYKALIHHLITCPQHVIICGREGLLWTPDDVTGETKATGTKMDAEKNTGYEPDYLLHMEIIRDPKTRKGSVAAFVEKDRSGILAQQLIVWPTFDNTVKYWLPYLENVAINIQSEDATASQDSEELTRQEEERQQKSAELLKTFKARLDLCKDAESFQQISKEITPEVKKQMTTSDTADLKKVYLEMQAKYPKGK